MLEPSIQLILADRSRIQGDMASLGGEAIQPAIGAQPGSASFGDSLRDAVSSVDAKERDAAGRMEAVDSGRSDDLVGAMLASQQASLSFSMLTQVRNKVVGAVDELSKLSL
ncbi:flagellar hook-basal body complex protein FliE [Vogesella sp. LIG4]|uniref:flagellar hook-basal body complex protein FliE n=1 Tax=Vogesella sp. LIG4 TaxID=1192162 RepID=UPI0008201EED|nr:flagellar hook-basal body complex protein FliE [Vogesella sp. LIG4]SCK17481.1 flagellar hook-basal body complex protein FliE [Vogesella sp. LIG4]